jgi:hypothetical protein
MNRKTYLNALLASAFALFAASSVNAEVKPDHSSHEHAYTEHAKVKAPNGGRMIESVEPHIEFFVTEDRYVKITFVDHEGAAVPVTAQSAALIGGDRSAPTQLKFEKVEGQLVSTEALPVMAKMPIMLQIKMSPDAKTVRERFLLNMSDCSSCDYKEYACVCTH